MRLQLPLAILLSVMILRPSTAACQSARCLVKDINPSPCGAHSLPAIDCSSSPRDLIAVGRTVFFSAAEPTGGRELWKTDGTEAGTVQVADINPGPASSNPSQLVQMNGMLFFIAEDRTGESQLWESDGTAQGTIRLADIAAIPRRLVAPTLKTMRGMVLLTDARWPQFWKTDGTAEGTTAFDFTGYDLPDVWDWNFTDFEGVVLFSLCDRGRECELWKTDGTQEGTSRVVSITPPYHDPAAWGEDPVYQPGSALFALTDLDGMLFFAACQLHDICDLWRSDGTAEGTVLVGGYTPSDPTDSDDWIWPEIASARHHLFFPACDGEAGCELWTSDGTASGTHLVSDINPGFTRSFSMRGPGFAAAEAGVLFYVIIDNATELWRSDGTEAGTYPINRGPGQSAARGDGSVWFLGSSEQGALALWKTDGTDTGTVAITSGDEKWIPGPSPRVPVLGDRIVLAGSDATHGQELWVISAQRDEDSCCADKLCDGVIPTTSSVTTTSTVPATSISTTSTSSSLTTSTSSSPTTSTSLPASPRATLGNLTCAPRRLVRRLRANLGRRPICEAGGATNPKRDEERMMAFRRTVARAVRRGHISPACASELRGVVPGCPADEAPK